MAQQLRTLISLTEDSGSVLSPSGSSQSPVTAVIGNPVPSFWSPRASAQTCSYKTTQALSQKLPPPKI